jgi:carbonic anhydrase/acetyltransferase-like protein (isoleucine patch superfamily)
MRGIQRSSSRLVSTFTRNNLTRKPQLHQTSYVAHGAAVIGNVNLGEQSSVWFNSVLRADINSISIGRRTNVQDGAVIHVYHSFTEV